MAGTAGTRRRPAPPPALVTHLTPADYREVPWRNGLGVTTEVLVQPPDAGGGFAWRISVATIARAGPFSPFPGYDRTILVLEGAGIALDFGPHGHATLARPFEPLAFAGEWPTTCSLLDGPVRALNVMVDRARVRLRTRVLPVASEAATIATGGTTLLFCLAGAASATVSAPPRVFALARHDLLRVESGTVGLAPSAPGSPGALVYRIDLDEAGSGC